LDIGQEFLFIEFMLRFEMKNIISLKRYFGYIRVSTVRQGQTSTSLVEQRSAIERYAQEWNLSIIQEYAEQETAAKAGRPIFRAMMKALKQGKASGIIIHKIDRSARNLKDWAELGELIDAGVEVHFANENLDLYSRGGRLSADIQAVVAADYIRNLREEVRKGFYGRIKQGFYPMPAPVGYINMGGGKAKTIDSAKGLLIKKTFELYATGNFGLRTLSVEMQRLGLRGRKGQTISLNGISLILRNVFYVGIIHIKVKKEYFTGKHLPIISKQLFDQVQTVLKSKSNRKTQNLSLAEVFLFRRFLTCKLCSYPLIGERQKGYLYYRCHKKTCPQKSIREELIEKEFLAVLKNLQCNSNQTMQFEQWIENRRQQMHHTVEEKRKLLKLQLEQIQNRLLVLADKLISGTIDERLFMQMKNKLVSEELSAQQMLDRVAVAETEILQQLDDSFRIAQSAIVEYGQAGYEQKRQLMTLIVCDFFVENKLVTITLNNSFETIHTTFLVSDCNP
jgi:site-specific DNA recombinase